MLVRLGACWDFSIEVYKVGSKHLNRRIGHRDMVQIEAVHWPTIDDGRIVGAGERGNGSCPLLDRVVKQRLPTKLRYASRHLLSRSCNLEQNAYLMWEVGRLRLPFAHHGIDAIAVKDDAVLAARGVHSQYADHAVLDVALELRQPGVKLANHVRIPDTTNDDALEAYGFGAFQLYRVSLRDELRSSDGDGHIIDCLVGAMRKVERAGTFAMQVGL